MPLASIITLISEVICLEMLHLAGQMLSLEISEALWQFRRQHLT